MDVQINMSLYQFFLYLSNATMCIPIVFREKVFQDMAKKLIQWGQIKREELIDVLDRFDIVLEQNCIKCDEVIPEFDYDTEPLCEFCLNQEDQQGMC
jgi:hypothetical protein